MSQNTGDRLRIFPEFRHARLKMRSRIQGYLQPWKEGFGGGCTKKLFLQGKKKKKGPGPHHTQVLGSDELGLCSDGACPSPLLSFCWRVPLIDDPWTTILKIFVFVERFQNLNFPHTYQPLTYPHSATIPLGQRVKTKYLGEYTLKKVFQVLWQSSSQTKG